MNVHPHLNLHMPLHKRIHIHLDTIWSKSGQSVRFAAGQSTRQSEWDKVRTKPDKLDKGFFFRYNIVYYNILYYIII